MIVTENLLFNLYSQHFPDKEDCQLELMVKETHEQLGYPQMYDEKLIVIGGIENELLSTFL